MHAYIGSVKFLCRYMVKCFSICLYCAELVGISPHNKLKAISFETMPCNPNKRLWIYYKL